MLEELQLLPCGRTNRVEFSLGQCTDAIFIIRSLFRIYRTAISRTAIAYFTDEVEFICDLLLSQQSHVLHRENI
jgi:hypothetical protein